MKDGQIQVQSLRRFTNDCWSLQAACTGRGSAPGTSEPLRCGVDARVSLNSNVEILTPNVLGRGGGGL